jgi:hypothetical protein
MLRDMKLLFSAKNRVQTFLIQGEILRSDLEVLRQSLLTFLESKPPFLVIDLSQSSSMVPEADLQNCMQDIRTVAQAQNTELKIAHSDFESMRAAHQVIENGLNKTINVLESKIELRRDIQNQLSQLKTENDRIRTILESPKPETNHWMNRLWGSK